GRRGAVTWGSGTAGVVGTVSADNSLIGAGGFTALRNGDYVVYSSSWPNGGVGHAGAAPRGHGHSGRAPAGGGAPTPPNSPVGHAANTGLAFVAEDSVNRSFLVAFPTENGGRLRVGLADLTQLTYARGQGQTIAITPDLVSSTLDTGTAVVLQASNDITVNDP